MSEVKNEVVLVSKFKGYHLFVEKSDFPDFLEEDLKLKFVNGLRRIGKDLYDNVIVHLLKNKLYYRHIRLDVDAPDGWIEDHDKRNLAIEIAITLGINYFDMKTSQIQAKIGYVQGMIDQAGFTQKQLENSGMTAAAFVDDLMGKMKADRASGTKSQDLLLKELKEECKTYPDFEPTHHALGYKNLKAQLEKHKLDLENAELVPA